MNRLDAHAILNAAKAGANVSEAHIKEALRATGDLSEYQPHGTAPKFSREDRTKPKAQWFSSSSAEVVA